MKPSLRLQNYNTSSLGMRQPTKTNRQNTWMKLQKKSMLARTNIIIIVPIIAEVDAIQTQHHL